MTNPFRARNLSVNGPATDILPVTPNNTTDLPSVAISLFVENGGSISFVTVSGHARTIQVSDFSFVPVGVSRVNATGTTASGIHALVLE